MYDLIRNPKENRDIYLSCQYQVHMKILADRIERFFEDYHLRLSAPDAPAKKLDLIVSFDGIAEEEQPYVSDYLHQKVYGMQIRAVEPNLVAGLNRKADATDRKSQIVITAPHLDTVLIGDASIIVHRGSVGKKFLENILAQGKIS